jgi:hypothetical protein
MAASVLSVLLLLGVLLGSLSSCSTSSLGSSELPNSAECNELNLPNEPDLLTLGPTQRAAFASVRAQGVAVVHYEQKGCDVRLELLGNCVARGQYQFVPYWEQDTKSARTGRELFMTMPVGALSVAGEMTGERSLRADYILAGMAELPIGYRFDASHLVGDCSRATHIVTRMYLGGFTLASGESKELAAKASVFVEVGAKSSSSLRRVRYAGDPESCEESKRSREEHGGCAAPLRLTLLPLGQTRECIGPDECQVRCDAGDTNSCNTLGGMYLNGQGVVADPPRAVRIFQQACDRGDMFGCGNLGTQYLYGSGVQQDFRQAASLLHRACTAGVPWGCRTLAGMHVNGDGVPKDLLLAASLFQSACRGGDAQGCNDAILALTQVCDAGDERGCLELGGMYGRGEGVQLDLNRAAALMTQACDKGLQDGCIQLGTMSLRGWGVPSDPARAMELYERYCNTLAVDGCFAMGMMYLNGDGVPKDDARALGYFERTCDGGEPLGCGSLGWMYLEGRGVQVDHARALSLFRSSCDAHCGSCCSGVADMYENGRGVKVNLALAKDFYGRACHAGDQDSCHAFERLQKSP